MGKQPGKKPKKRDKKPAAQSVTLVMAPVSSVEEAEACVDRVGKTAQYIRCEIVAGAAPGLAERLAELPIATVVEAESPVASIAAGIASASGAEIVALLDPRLVVEDGWLKALLKGVQEPGAAIAGGRMIAPDGLLASAGFHTDPMLGLVARGAGKSASFFEALQQAPVPAVDLGASVLTRSVLDSVGGLDVTLDPLRAGVDFCLRATALGFRSQYCPGCRALDRRAEGQGKDVVSQVLSELGDLDRFYTKWAHLSSGTGGRAADDLKEYARRFDAAAAERVKTYGVTNPSRVLRTAVGR